jgi:FkbM family methyltransferase
MRITSNLIKALRLIDQQGFKIFRILGKGYSLSSCQIVDGIATYRDDFKIIIDVGANRGQFAIASCRRFPNAKIISFEPLPELCKAYRKNLQGYDNVLVHNLALGKEKALIDFYRNEHSHASSALVISEKQKEEIPTTSKTTKIQVQVDRLDNVISSNAIASPILLKLDVQGYEKNVLQGATGLLPKIDYLVFEASFTSMYDGEPLYDEMHFFLKSLGFEIVAPVGFLEGKNGAILQMDFLYRNKGR